MKIAPGATKRGVLLIWVIAVSAFLYYFSASMTTGISLMNFMNFTILMWGGSVAYHVTTKLIDCPQTGHNEHLWRFLMRKLFKVYVGYIITGIAILAGRKFGGEWGWLIALIGLIFGYLWVMNYIFSLTDPIKNLLNTQINGTNTDI